MSGLYRCRCRVGYRPYRSNKLIVFQERQVIQASLNLNWTPNAILMNQDSATPTTEFASALNGSTANITLSDPYMTGIAWAALFDSAAAYNSGTQAAAYHILLPACKEGEDPTSKKCTDIYQVIDDPQLGENAYGDFAHILIKFYYEVKGVVFGLDTYFRLQGFNITHGSTYPQVQLQGIEPRVVSFNQTLANFQFKEGDSVDETVRKIAKEYNNEVSFCNNVEARSKSTYVMPRSFRERAVTGEEVLRKYLASVGGSITTMPTKEFANKISVCTRANVNQGCSVFYLGKGLYERYSISGNVDNNTLNRNVEYEYNPGLAYEFDTQPFTEQTYTIDDILPNRRRGKLKDAKTSIAAPPDQFTVYTKRYSAPDSLTGFVWRGPGPEISTERLSGVNMYGIGVNGNKSLALLDGEVISVGEGRILISTNYFIRYCDKSRSCYNKPIYQESVNVNSIKENIKKGVKVKLNEELGTTTTDKPEFFRFYISGKDPSDNVTIQPQLVWKYAAPYEGLTDEEKKRAGLKGTEESPASSSATPQPDPGGEVFVARIGNTGSSTGPHVHIQWSDQRQITEEQVRKYIKVEGNVTSRWGPRTRPCPTCSADHKGIDIANAEGTPIYLINGASLAAVVENRCRNGDASCGGRLGNYITIQTPEGKMDLGHLAPDSIKGDVTGRVAGPGSSFGQGVQGGPATIGAEVTTEFLGVPRALRIVPGRTILSFITRYDEWIEKGRPSDIDPGIWIPSRFANWFVKSAQYNWTGGNLRVSLTGVTDWGNLMSRIKVPSFENYLKSYKAEFVETKDYYGYIRGLGDLCWKVGDKTSCEVICEEAQRIGSYLSGPASGEETGSVGNTFPPSQCTRRGSKKDVSEQIMGALRSAGINTKAGYAGVLGNLEQESGLDWNIHTTSRQGVTCVTTSGSPEKCYGLIQWGGGRKARIAERCSGGDGTKPSSLACQLEFMVSELKGPYKSIVGRMNAAKSPEEASEIWRNSYEVGQNSSARSTKARAAFNELDCQSTNP